MATPKKRSNWSQESRHKRGYGTAWDKLRIRVLTRDKYLCQPCYRRGRPEPASQVDHIVPKSQEGTDDPSNLEAICTKCHRVKTAHENRGRLFSEIGCDANGIPNSKRHHWSA